MPSVEVTGAAAGTGRARFRSACACERLDRPPVWLMRQAGRALPEYRALKERHSFLELVQTPELATEVTLQPIRRFGFDAAILFSDILVIAEALGQPYRFREGGGIQMDFRLESAADIERLEPAAVTERLQYVAGALRLLRRALGEETALLGFSGAPWTLANFMLEGGSASPFTRAKQLLTEDPSLYARLAEKLAQAIIDYLRLQVAEGVDAVQLFDTLAGEAGEERFPEASGRWLEAIIAGLGAGVPVIVFAKGVHRNWAGLAGTGARVVGVDWKVNLAEVRRALPAGIAVQGNLDPRWLTQSVEEVRSATRAILTEMRGAAGHIFNLGHGVPPEAKLENLAALVDTVRTFA